MLDEASATFIAELAASGLPPLHEMSPREAREAGARMAELDVIVFATGFDAMTGALLHIDIRGREDRSLKDKWSVGPRTHLGLSIEQHVDWIADCIGHLRERAVDTIEATRDAEDRWVAHVNEVAEATLFPQANSWYAGANIPGKSRVFMPYLGGVGAYRTHCDAVAAGGYEGFSVR